MTNKYNGKLLRFSGVFNQTEQREFLNSLPRRNDFVDKPLTKQVISQVKANAPVWFMPNDILEKHIKEPIPGKTGNSLVYKLILFGVLTNGSKAAVVLDNIRCFLDVRVPDIADSNRFRKTLYEALKAAKSYCTHIEERFMRPFKYYSEKEKPYLRIFFNTLFARKAALKYLLNNEIQIVTVDKNKETAEATGTAMVEVETASNDESCYYRTVGREYKFHFGNWNRIQNYTLDDTGDIVKKTSVLYTFRCSVENFIPIMATGVDKQKHIELRKDKSMVMCWDLETYDHVPTGNAPEPNDVFDEHGNDRSIIFMDGISFHWYYDNTPLVTVNITDLITPAQPDCLTIRVDNQIDIIKIKSILIGRMCPEFVTGFNDGCYDWPHIFRKAEAYDKRDQLELMDYIKRNCSCIPFNEENAKWGIRGASLMDNIKVEAGTNLTNEILEVPGFISIDTRTIFRQLYPTAESSSLSFYLARNKLGSKEDMPYLTMFKIYRLTRKLEELFDSSDYDTILARINELQEKFGSDFMLLAPEGLTKAGLAYKNENDRRPDGRRWASKVDKNPCKLIEASIGEIISLLGETKNVVKYCNVDAIRCQELLNIRNVIPDKREVSNLSFTSVWDCFYRANGMKVRNLVISEGVKPEWNIAFNNIGNKIKDKRKYTGAYVVPPVKGLYRDHKCLKRARRAIEVDGKMFDLPVFQETSGNPETSGFPESKTKTETKIKQKIPYERVSPENPLFDSRLLQELESWLDSEILNRNNNRRSNDDNDKNDRPCTGLDFSSLYPSLIMAYNLSPEKAIKTLEEAEAIYHKLLKKYPGRSFSDLIHHAKFKYGFDGDPDHLKTEVEGWFVRHVGVIMPDKSIKYEGMGLYPFILKNLFDQRNVIKKDMHTYAGPREYMENCFGDKGLDKSDPDAPTKIRKFLSDDRAALEAAAIEAAGTRKADFISRKIRAHGFVEKYFADNYFADNLQESMVASKNIEELYNNTCFFCNYYNSKQLALKVFMNTFYGETGNSLSPFFLVSLAGGITTAGKNNIHMVKKYVEQCGYTVLYGDTDSLYITCPEAAFKETDEKYESGEITKVQYWTHMIEITMETIDKFKEDVNKLLKDDNGTVFLTMAYEEVLWPFAFAGKKKYIGIKHEGVVDLSACMPDCNIDRFMKSRSLFIRGLELIKRGSSGFLKYNCFEIVRRAFNISTTDTLRDVCLGFMEEITSIPWKPEMFAKSARYKQPGVDEFGKLRPGNVSVLRFVERMRELEKTNPEFGLKCPELGERFQYIIARKYPWKYDLRGRKCELKMSDKYELLSALGNEKYNKYLEEPLEIDMDYYMENEVAGQFARFIVYHPEYDIGLISASERAALSRELESSLESSLESKSKTMHEKVDWENMTDAQYKEADKKAIGYAKKLLCKYYQGKFARKYESRATAYKVLYKQTSQAIQDSMLELYGCSANLFSVTENITTDLDAYGESNFDIKGKRKAYLEKLLKDAEKRAKKGITKYITKMLKATGENVYQLYFMYVSSPRALCKTWEPMLKKQVHETTKELARMIIPYQKICDSNLNIMKTLNEKLRENNETLLLESLDKNTAADAMAIINESYALDAIEDEQVLQEFGFTRTDYDEFASLGSVAGSAVETAVETAVDVSTVALKKLNPINPGKEKELMTNQDFLDKMYNKFIHLVALVRFQKEIEEIKNQLTYRKQMEASKNSVSARPIPKTINVKNLQDQFHDWLGGQ